MPYNLTAFLGDHTPPNLNLEQMSAWRAGAVARLQGKELRPPAGGGSASINWREGWEAMAGFLTEGGMVLCDECGAASDAAGIQRPGRMSLERALEIHGRMVSHHLADQGVPGQEPESLVEFSLAELLEAKDLVSRASNLGGGVHRLIVDDRLLAALYVVHHYQGSDLAAGPAQIIANGAGNSLVVVRSDTAGIVEDEGEEVAP